MNRDALHRWVSAHMARHRTTAALVATAATGWALAISLIGLVLTTVMMLAGLGVLAMALAAVGYGARRVIGWCRRPAAARQGLQKKPPEITLTATVIRARHA